MSSTTTRTTPAWKKENRAWHDVTPPSGTPGAEIRIPGLIELTRDEAVPARLRAIAIKAAAHPAGLRGVMADRLKASNDANDGKGETDEEIVADENELNEALFDVIEIQKRLITKNVRIGGELVTLEDLEDQDFPEQDKEWYGGVMLREEQYDARGVRLGIEPLDAWSSFRQFHDCGPSCPSCAALQDAFSSVDLGVV